MENRSKRRARACTMMPKSLFWSTVVCVLIFCRAVAVVHSAASFVAIDTSRTRANTNSEGQVFPPASLFSRRSDTTSTRLFGISEWRDLVFNLPGSKDNRRLGREPAAPPKSVCILPFPYTDVLLQGETKQLRLYEDRFIKLFEDAMQNHGGVVAMGLLAQSGIIQTVPLCEIEAYNRMAGFGIFVTIRIVSRAQLLEVTQHEPYLKAVCFEIDDALPPNLELPNLLASNIENFMLQLSSMEHRLEQAKLASKGNRDSDDNSGEADLDMERRIKIAQLDDRFYMDDNEDEDEGDVDEFEEEDILPDRRRRFQKAYEVALATDTQGYRVASLENQIDRTAQELTAISWAAFCTDILPDATFRIQALDCDNLFERLKLASQMLRQKKSELETKIEEAGLKLKGDDSEGEQDGKSRS